MCHCIYSLAPRDLRVLCLGNRVRMISEAVRHCT